MFKVGDRVKSTIVCKEHNTGTVVDKKIKVQFDNCKACQSDGTWVMPNSLELIESTKKAEPVYAICVGDLERAELLIRREAAKLPSDWTTSKQVLENTANEVAKFLEAFR